MVRVCIDIHTKERAAEALEAMGLAISDAIRLLMLHVADERRFFACTSSATSIACASSDGVVC
ncbi:MAG: type II toxin-antitoxin system RelB/DinJ family antitoxin [Burkholderiaceae bacterium]|nr:type II toxin-antitoxin system RelB/DinJ family antitoxin [Burkholderiaceae bacterium]